MICLINRLIIVFLPTVRNEVVIVVNILHYVSKMDRAGQETFLMNVFRNIDREKVNFGFLCTLTDAGDYDKEIKELNGEIYYAPIHTKGHLKIIKNFWSLKKVLKTLTPKYQIFEIHTQHAMDAFISSLAAKSAGFETVIVHSHNSSTLYHRNLHYVFRPLLSCLSITRFACSNSAGKWMYWKRKYKIIKNGIDLQKFVFSSEKRKKVRTELNWHGKIIIGHVGRFNSQKNQTFAVKIFNEFHKKHSNSELVFIGTGENIEGVKNEAKRLGLQNNVKFLGVRTDVNRLYQGMDVFLFPSLFEGLPVVLVETQTSSLPSLVSNKITTEVKITDKLYFKDLNSTSIQWAMSLEDVLEESKKRSDMTKEITNAGYNIKNVAQELQEIYISLQS